MNAKQFKHIYYPYREKMYRIAFRLLENTEQTEDAVQEAYMKLWNNRHELKDIVQPEAYTITILRNICLNQIRWRKDKIVVDYDWEMADRLSLDLEIELKDDLSFLEKLMNKLPEHIRQIIELRHNKGYSYDEISEITGLDIAHIRVVVSRARKTLRDELEKIHSYECK